MSNKIIYQVTKYFTEDGFQLYADDVKELEASEERLKARTWEQEREAILAYIRLCKIVVGGKTAKRLEILASDIECGEHWKMKENQND